MRFLIAETPTSLGLDLAFSHDFLGDEADIDYSLGGKKFTATAQLLPENTISVSPFIGVAITESTRVYAAYTFAAGTDSAISHSANVGFSYRF